MLRLGGAGRFVWSGSPLAAIQVTGIWGWHERWSLAWQSGVDSAQDNPLAASATMLQVTDSSRFEAGQLLRLGDEYLRLLAIDEARHSLRVLRAAQGTAAVGAQPRHVDRYLSAAARGDAALPAPGAVALPRA